MQFTKMQGLGNDYVYINTLEQDVTQPEQLAPIIADRHFGVGSDGLILLMKADDGVDAHVRMRMFNADGSEAEMCGNGIRCLCKLAHDDDVCTQNPMRVQTAAGVLSLAYQLDAEGRVSLVTVDMGEPVLNLAEVPVDATKLLLKKDQAAPAEPNDGQFDLAIPEHGDPVKASFVSMGNPHAVIFVDRIDRDAHLKLGQQLEHHPAFPNRMNVHFVERVDDAAVNVLHWERGSGATLACGTGACAVAVAGVLAKKTGSALTANLPGGPLQLQWEGPGKGVKMTGPAQRVFDGTFLMP